MRKAKDTLLNTASENRTKVKPQVCKVGDYVYINKGTLSRKLTAPHDGPYRINETNQTANGTWFRCK